MIVCYQYWFIPKDAFNEGIDLRPKSIFSKKNPDEPRETSYGIYEEVMVAWKIKIK